MSSCAHRCGRIGPRMVVAPEVMVYSVACLTTPKMIVTTIIILCAVVAVRRTMKWCGSSHIHIKHRVRIIFDKGCFRWWSFGEQLWHFLDGCCGLCIYILVYGSINCFRLNDVSISMRAVRRHMDLDIFNWHILSFLFFSRWSSCNSK